ncbi:MAG TPA: hypothetical protein VFY51_04950 [Pyrinomonadaceae bacterium]|nr:hypothetical protein [Pyrinomonadaceae bacterium]
MRNSLERPDAITASAVSAREQIGRAVADQIRQLQSAKDLERVAEDVLPSFEKFLESPEEKRLRRIRNGVITACVGLGGALTVLIMALNTMNLWPMMLPWLITFMIGVGVIVNGLLFTVPGKQLPGDVADAMSQKALDMNRGSYEGPARTNELGPGMQPQPSITEHTTHHLTTSKN